MIVTIKALTQNKDYYVIQGHSRSPVKNNGDDGTSWKPICDFQLVINTNLQPVSYRLEVMAYCLDFGRKTVTAFWASFGEVKGNILCTSEAH